MCYLWRKPAKEPGYINANDCYRFIPTLKEFGKIPITVHIIGGEPLLEEECLPLVNFISQQGFRSVITSNGYLIDEETAKRIADSGLNTMNLSLETLNENTHDELRGINGIFKKAIAGIKYCKKYNIKCYISTYATKNNLKNGELDKIIELAVGLDVKLRILSPICSGNWFNQQDITLSSNEILLLKSFLKKNIVYWEYEHIDDKKTPFYCHAFLKNYFYVSAYGDIQPCCFMPIAFGNIRKEPLRNILKKMWNSNIFINTHKKFNDCPMNDKNFRERHFGAIKTVGKLPEETSINL